ncbi:MAG: hypothetical protein MUF64_21250 [Polyangiaceae bacterium]|jgi:hypothetical protein|nr:hypothetical protein [Polyangiaceae bacterium]
MNPPSAPPAGSDTVSLFRLAFAIVGALLFGASMIVGLATLFAGGYTTSLRCDRPSGVCTIQFRSVSKQIPLAELQAVERRLDKSSRSRSPAQVLYAVYPAGKTDFLCAAPDAPAEIARLDTLAAEASAFLAGSRPSLDLRCEGKVASVADGVLMTSLSAILAAASFLTLFRGVRRLMQHKTPVSGGASKQQLS